MLTSRKLPYQERSYAMKKATNILWDTDGDDEVLESLPTEIPIPDGMTDEDEISDYISNETGFCHAGFVIEDE